MRITFYRNVSHRGRFETSTSRQRSVRQAGHPAGYFHHLYGAAHAPGGVVHGLADDRTPARSTTGTSRHFRKAAQVRLPSFRLYRTL